jgi:hypothetical protein
VARLYPQALGSFFVATYDSQGYGGGIRPRLQKGVWTILALTVLLITLLYGSSRKYRLQQYLYSCTRIRCRGKVFTELLPRNGSTRYTENTSTVLLTACVLDCLQSCCLATRLSNLLRYFNLYNTSTKRRPICHMNMSEAGGEGEKYRDRRIRKSEREGRRTWGEKKNWRNIFWLVSRCLLRTRLKRIGMCSIPEVSFRCQLYCKG